MTTIKFIVLSLFASLLSFHPVFATVGGPTYVSSIAYKTSDNSVYYIVNDYSGRGCPPIIHKVDLNTLKDAEVNSCDNFDFSESGMQKHNQFIADTYQGLSYLGSVSFEKNNIDIRVEFLNEQVENDERLWSEFRASVSQDNKQIGTINFQGCTKDQPHVFEGYMVPNSDAMAILISNKGDCFEGGYVEETLHVIKGVQYYNKDIVRYMKTESATEPNLANVVVYADKENSTNNPPPSTAPKNSGFSPMTLGLMAITLILGSAIGYLVGKKTS